MARRSWVTGGCSGYCGYQNTQSNQERVLGGISQPVLGGLGNAVTGVTAVPQITVVTVVTAVTVRLGVGVMLALTDAST